MSGTLVCINNRIHRRSASVLICKVFIVMIYHAPVAHLWENTYAPNNCLKKQERVRRIVPLDVDIHTSEMSNP